jgi:serine/threonine protein kinase
MHLVTDYFPDSLATFMSSNRPAPLTYVKLFGFQMFSALCYLHAHGVCHRDIKPSNVLVDQETGRVQLCDFGSAKYLKPKEQSVSYIATRSYRAPELLLGCPFYTTAIDIWAAGCVLEECFCDGKPVFTGGDNVELMESISAILGPPHPRDFNGFPHPRSWPAAPTGAGLPRERFARSMPNTFIDLLGRVFVYAPEKRATAADCMRHPFFADLLDGAVTFPNGQPLPDYLLKMKTPDAMLANFPNGP